MEKIVCGNGHVAVGGPGRPGGRRAGEGFPLVLGLVPPQDSLYICTGAN
jgi:hypothetical protein